MLSRQNAVVALLFIAAGLLLSLGSYINLSHYAWPFAIILPGVFLFTLTFMLEKAGRIFAIPAMLVTTTGFILLGQLISGYFASWAYAWTLLVSAVGLGAMLQGHMGSSDAMIRFGSRALVAGLIAFVIFAFVFELFIFAHWTQGIWGSIILPVALISLGLLFWKSTPSPGEI